MDEATIRAFVDRDHARVVAAVTFVCGDAGRAEDAVQEALAAAWLHRRPIDNPRAWVTKVAINKARSRFRSLGAEERAYERAASFARPPAAERQEAGLLPELDALPAGQRDAVVLHYLLDLSVADVATALGVSTGTVKTQLHRAREALRIAVVEADHVG